jgi:hypothetical protein
VEKRGVMEGEGEEPKDREAVKTAQDQYNQDVLGRMSDALAKDRVVPFKVIDPKTGK